MGQHSKLAKIRSGHHSPNEIAVYGTTCADLQELVKHWANQFEDCRLVYLDASHDHTSIPSYAHCTTNNKALELLSPSSGELEKQNFLRLFDLTLVNGNHWPAHAQIIIFNPSKLESLIKRKDQLNYITAFVGTPEALEQLTHQGFDMTQARIFENPHDAEFVRWLQSQAAIPQVRGLILTGGKSLRMGHDKSHIQHHQLPQYLHLRQIFADLGLPVWLSCRSEQADSFQWPKDEMVMDRIMEIGPIAGLLSAWMQTPTAALLTVACDMPFLTTRSLKQLLDQRQRSAVATTLHLPGSDLPEPMITLWEPRAYPMLLQWVSTGQTCPRKFLIQANVHSVEAAYNEELVNINTPEELAKYQR
jgi:molybdenum cofactor guanylyltransferase